MFQQCFGKYFGMSEISLKGRTIKERGASDTPETHNLSCGLQACIIALSSHIVVISPCPLFS